MATIVNGPGQARPLKQLSGVDNGSIDELSLLQPLSLCGQVAYYLVTTSCISAWAAVELFGGFGW